jgi:hypothetical protein
MGYAIFLGATTVSTLAFLSISVQHDVSYLIFFLSFLPRKRPKY